MVLITFFLELFKHSTVTRLKNWELATWHGLLKKYLNTLEHLFQEASNANKESQIDTGLICLFWLFVLISKIIFFIWTTVELFQLDITQVELFESNLVFSVIVVSKWGTHLQATERKLILPDVQTALWPACWEKIRPLN